MSHDERYSRQSRFAAIGDEGQRAISASRVLLVGCGALGTHLAEMLTRAGVARLTIVDRDVLEESNLQRQSLFDENDVRQRLPKAIAAERHLQAINAHVVVQGVVGDFAPDNAEEMAEDADLILDATDNFETRFLMNDVAVKLGLPWVYAACIGATALAMPIVPGETACLACVLGDAPGPGGETCETSGIIMPAVAAAVAMAGAEALKLLAGRPEALVRRLQMLDLWRGTSMSIAAEKPIEGCEVCQKRVFAWLSGRKAGKTVRMCGRNAVQIMPARRLDLSFDELAKRIEGVAKIVARNDFLMQIEARGRTLTLFRDGRALIGGTQDLGEARALYAQFIGS